MNNDCSCIANTSTFMCHEYYYSGWYGVNINLPSQLMTSLVLALAPKP